MDESLVPKAVRQCDEFLKVIGVWHAFTRNTPAMSCQDAARKRVRLGHRGIPLWDELKSFLGEHTSPTGSTMLFLAHCRGDRQLDYDRLCHALGGGTIRRLKDSEAEQLGFEYGTINPFVAMHVNAPQLFDIELMRPIGAPGTIMTNAGEHTWAVEFDPAELVLKLPGSRWAEIIDPAMQDGRGRFGGLRAPDTVGILTGNPMDSGLDLCHSLNLHTRRLLGDESLGDVSMPRVFMVSSPHIGISMEMDLRAEPLRKSLLDGIDELCNAGARILAHPAHTTHFFKTEIGEFAKARGARFISIAQVTATRLINMGVKEITLLGTRYVTDLNQPWSPYHNAFPGISVHTPSMEGWTKIHSLGYEVQQRGPTSKCFNWMRDLLREEVPSSCEHVLLLMTEFSPVVRQLKERGRQGRILIDPIDIYGEALACAYLGLPFR